MAMEQVQKDQLKSVVERIEKLMDDMTSIKADIKAVYKEAKDEGFDTKALKDIVKLRKKDKDEISEQDEIIRLYRNALDM